MRTPAQFMGHPLHPMLIAFPIALWTTSLICDFVFRVRNDVLWDTLAFYSLAGGVIGAIAAAVPGLVDFFSIPSGTLAKKKAVAHMFSNVIALGLFAMSLRLRTQLSPGALVPFILSILGFLSTAVGGWLGSSLIYKHHVAVHETGITL
jgi:uncharacterized membrane protein